MSFVEPVKEAAEAYAQEFGRRPGPLDVPTDAEADVLLGMCSGRIHFDGLRLCFHDQALGHAEAGRDWPGDAELAFVLHAHDWVDLQGITAAGRIAAQRFLDVREWPLPGPSHGKVRLRVDGPLGNFPHADR